jgi:transposase-like protein
MKKNQVQFQSGMSLMVFLERYGTEEQCREALVKARWPKGWRCPDCGHTGHCHLKRRDVYQCNHCKRQVSLTSGTLFAETKLPLRTWFLAIYLLTQHKNGISVLALWRQLGVSYNTAWLLKHKLMQAMVERDSDRCRLHAYRHPHRRWHPRSGHPIFTWVNTMLGNVKNALHGTYHALRPKYLQRYLSEFCYRFNRRFDLAALVPRLIVAAARTPPLNYRLATLDA